MPPPPTENERTDVSDRRSITVKRDSPKMFEQAAAKREVEKKGERMKLKGSFMGKVLLFTTLENFSMCRIYE